MVSLPVPCLPSAQAGNPSCVNPNHLWLGDFRENIRDMDKKSRRALPRRGEKNGMSKLTISEVREIRNLLNEGYTQKQISNLYSITQGHISDIKRGRRWGWLDKNEAKSP